MRITGLGSSAQATSGATSTIVRQIRKLERQKQKLLDKLSGGCSSSSGSSQSSGPQNAAIRISSPNTSSTTTTTTTASATTASAPATAQATTTAGTPMPTFTTPAPAPATSNVVTIPYSSPITQNTSDDMLAMAADDMSSEEIMKMVVLLDTQIMALTQQLSRAQANELAADRMKENFQQQAEKASRASANINNSSASDAATSAAAPVASTPDASGGGDVDCFA